MFSSAHISFFVLEFLLLSGDQILLLSQKQLLIVCTRDMKISPSKTAPERLPSGLGLRL